MRLFFLFDVNTCDFQTFDRSEAKRLFGLQLEQSDSSTLKIQNPKSTIKNTPHILLMGQTPPPWHGQAVATQILFEHEWPGFEIHRLRMEYSEEMVEVGRFQFRKLVHLFRLILEARKILTENPGCILFYPPASAKWVPFLRDAVFLSCVRHLAGGTVFIFHASGLPVFTERSRIARLLARLAYRDADVSLEVAQEAVPPHEVFGARHWRWCPCAIDIPPVKRPPVQEGKPLTALFVGSLQEGKGVLEVLRTAAALKEKGRAADFRFQMVGKWFSANFRKQTMQLSSALGLEGIVEFSGQLTGDEKWEAYASADVFFFPTHYASEASPIVIMEALGAGMPILSTQWAGIPAMLEGCSAARLLPIRSPSLYADALLALYAGRSREAATSEAAKMFYRENFLPERFIERVRDAFETVLEWQTEPLRNARPEPPPPVIVSAYLADQNPGYDRSFGISRMTQVVLDALQKRPSLDIEVIVSETSQQAPESISSVQRLPWGTRKKWIRLLTDHFHPLFSQRGRAADLSYYPKGYLPMLSGFCHPSVVTIHDTIIQYDEDNYPQWRNRFEYGYWEMLLKHTLREADAILTVSETSKGQIESFMDRHGIPRKAVEVTYEPCLYERIPQPVAEEKKKDFVIHLASCEPHKRTEHLIRWWDTAMATGRTLPTLHLIGNVPPEAAHLVERSKGIVKRPFLDDLELQDAYRSARALILPSEIEGFGLPALEAYYLGTPVCFVRETSVEEILAVATGKGGFTLDESDSLFAALDEVIAMSPDEIRECGLKLRETYTAEKVAERMMAVFHRLAGR